MINKIFTKYVSTKMDEESEAVKTILTIDMSDLTQDDEDEIAVSASVVKWQARVRNAKSIPEKATYKVPKPGTKIALSLDEQVERLSEEKALELLEKLQAKLNK